MISECRGSTMANHSVGNSLPTFGDPLYSCVIFIGVHIIQQFLMHVYNAKIGDKCWNGTIHYNCYWVARPDGFYFSNDNKSWEKIHNWI
ncbi:hypothetical protein RHGRI_033362 [Rhododendron griersonianum]|uniref:S-protein homolog n=1 Tax=Rhododendron griersonianum TaxID=479676 RepID=A0AAV6I0N9_9ERIC|nr:hypothetical protein RHGRI_033362 [Rhododendron griersonianum]